MPRTLPLPLPPKLLDCCSSWRDERALSMRVRIMAASIVKRLNIGRVRVKLECARHLLELQRRRSAALAQLSSRPQPAPDPRCRRVRSAKALMWNDPRLVSTCAARYCDIRDAPAEMNGA